MTDGPSTNRPPSEPSRRDPESLRDVLSNDELKELLSPLGVPSESGGPRSAVLFISDQPTDVEALSDYLRPRAIVVVPARDRFAALDVFRQRPFLGVIADIDSIGSDVAQYVRRLEEVRQDVVVRFVCAPGESAKPRAQRMEVLGKVVERPLDATALAVLCSFLPEQAPEQLAGGNGGVIRQQPDPLVAVRALLETQILGPAKLVDGLRRWWELDPAVTGMVTTERDDEEWVLRGRASDDVARREMMQSGVDLFDTPPENDLRPQDSFYVFRDPERPKGAIGMWRGPHATADTAAHDLCERLEPLLPLIARATGAAQSEPAAPIAGVAGRDTLMGVLDARMRSCERRDGRLGLLVVRGPSADAEALQAELREALRGSDWSVTDAGVVYALLDEPGQGWQAALDSRLQQLASFSTMQVVAVPWAPSHGSASALVERAERALEDVGVGTVRFLNQRP